MLFVHNAIREVRISETIFRTDYATINERIINKNQNKFRFNHKTKNLKFSSMLTSYLPINKISKKLKCKEWE